MTNLPDPLPVPQTADEGRHEYYFWQIVWDCLGKNNDGKAFRTQIKVGGEEAIVRWFLPYLSDAQLNVLTWTRGRVLGWAKLAEIIPTKHYVEGVTNRDGETIHGACGIKKEQNVRKAIRDLKEMRLITTFPARPLATGYTSRCVMPFDRTLFVLAANVLQRSRGDDREHGWLWKAVVGHHEIDPTKRKIADILLGDEALERAWDAAWLDWFSTEHAHEHKAMIAPQVAGLSWHKTTKGVESACRDLDSGKWQRENCSPPKGPQFETTVPQRDPESQLGSLWGP